MPRRSRGQATLNPALSLLLLVLIVGNSHGLVLMVPETYGTIQAAVDAAASTDTVAVAPGTYSGPGNRDIAITNKSILLRSREGHEMTVIDCSDLTRALLIDGWNSRPIIEGFTIRNGRGTQGGAVLLGIASPTFRYCVFASNHSSLGGAGKLGYSATFEDCQFLGNVDTGGGGAIYALQGSTSFLRCVFSGNQSIVGGAVRTDAATLTFTECTITANACSRQGGGIFSFGSPISLERTICRGNCAESGEEIYSNRTVTLRCCDVDTTGVLADQLVLVDIIDGDALFCDPRSCDIATEAGDYRLRADSPCLPEGNPCGVLIGALGGGCPAPLSGACCLPEGDCQVVAPDVCEALDGRYVGSDVDCDPNPCDPVPSVPVTWGRIKAGHRR